MVRDWFRGAKARTVNELILRKDYAKAIELISAELEQNRRNERLRLQRAHLLTLVGKKAEAVEVLDDLAHDLATDGFAAKAIAVLKKIQKLDPARAGVEERLASLIEGQASTASWVDTGPRPEIGLEIGLQVREPAPIGVSDSGEVAPPPEKPADTGPSRRAPAQERRALETPLFRGMSRDEILAVIRELRLHSLDPGHIVVTEGEPGDSLFVLTTGHCRAHVRNPAGRNMEVRRLREGDFFGEISVLTGQPRSATITTQTPCELLELDRTSLDSIVDRHPRVRDVLQEFHSQRAGSTIEATIRGMQEP